MSFPNLNYVDSWNLPSGGYESFNLDPASSNLGAWQPSSPVPGSYVMSNTGLAQDVPLDNSGWNWFDSVSNGQVQQGVLGTMIGGASALTNAYLGMKQYGLAKDTLKFNKEMFAKNFASQKSLTNASLEDRQRARVASNPGAYESVSAYMDKNGIK